MTTVFRDPVRLALLRMIDDAIYDDGLEDVWRRIALEVGRIEGWMAPPAEQERMLRRMLRSRPGRGHGTRNPPPYLPLIVVRITGRDYVTPLLLKANAESGIDLAVMFERKGPPKVSRARDRDRRTA